MQNSYSPSLKASLDRARRGGGAVFADGRFFVAPARPERGRGALRRPRRRNRDVVCVRSGYSAGVAP